MDNLLGGREKDATLKEYFQQQTILPALPHLLPTPDFGANILKSLLARVWRSYLPFLEHLEYVIF